MINRLKNGEISDVEISELITFAKDNGGIKYAEQVMSDYRQKALALLPETIDEDLKKSLIAYIDMVINRKK
jgi:octaprenyl-diphosphate synthase